MTGPFSVLDKRNPCHQADTCTPSRQCELFAGCERIDRCPVNGLNFEADYRLRAVDIKAAYPLTREAAVERVREGLDSIWRRP